jgi:SnoaL-like domain
LGCSRRVNGDADGTRELIDVLLLHRSLDAGDIEAGISAALGVGAVSADVVAVEARRHATEHLSAGDSEQLISLFASDGVVNSPLYGKLQAKDFYPALFSDTSASVLTLRKTLQSVDGDTTTIAFWFDFDWTLADGTPAPFTVVDVAELDEHGLIQQLHIVYDTHPLRESWTRQHNAERRTATPS